MNTKDNKYWANKMKNKNDQIILEDVLLHSTNEKEKIDLLYIQSASDELKNWKNFDKTIAWEQINRKNSIKRFSFVKYAASIVILIAFGLSFLLLQNNSVEYKSDLTSLHLVLQDGSDIILSPNSKLVLSSSFDDNSREVRLEGNAYFNIERNTSNPFIINTDKGEVKVLGTIFYVKQDKDLLKVDLISGKVKVSNNAGESVFIEENESALVNSKIIVQETKSFDDKIVEDLVFDNVTIKDAINIFNEIYGEKIIVLEDENSYLLNESIHTTVKNSSVREFINGLKLIFNVEVVYSKGKFTISAVKNK